MILFKVFYTHWGNSL